MRAKYVSDRGLLLILSIFVGILSGLASVVLKLAVHYISYGLSFIYNLEWGNSLYLAMPLLGIFITVYYIKSFVKEDISHGVTKILYSIPKNQAKIKIHNTYSSIITCAITNGFGGSVGMEAPILYTGAAIGSNIAQKFRLNFKTTTLLVGCGVAAAMASIFKAPIAGLIFVLEVLMIDLTATSLIPLLIASVTGQIVAIFLSGKQIEFYFSLKDTFNYNHMPFYIIFGVFTGFISVYFTRVNYKIESFFKKITKPYTKVLIGGSLLGVLIFLFPPLYGEGYDALKLILGGTPEDIMQNSLFVSYKGNMLVFLGFILLMIVFKVFSTTFTTGGGGIGGVFAPSLFIGGLAGFFFASTFNYFNIVSLSISNFALVGMAGLIAGVIHAPLTAIFLIAEITGGYELFIPLILTSLISYTTIMIFEPHSIYTSKLASAGELISHDKDKTVLTLLNLKSVIETNFICVYPYMTLGDLVKEITKTARNIFPVVDKDNYFLGVITLDEIRHIMFEHEKYNDVYVKDYMIQPLSSVSSTDTMEFVMKKFQETKYWNLPVIDNGKYVGFVSRANVFNAYREQLKEFCGDE